MANDTLQPLQGVLTKCWCVVIPFSSKEWAESVLRRLTEDTEYEGLVKEVELTAKELK